MVQKIAVLIGFALLAWVVARLAAGSRRVLHARVKTSRSHSGNRPVRLEEDPATGIYRPIDRDR